MPHAVDAESTERVISVQRTNPKKFRGFSISKLLANFDVAEKNRVKSGVPENAEECPFVTLIRIVVVALCVDFALLLKKRVFDANLREFVVFKADFRIQKKDLVNIKGVAKKRLAMLTGGRYLVICRNTGGSARNVKRNVRIYFIVLFKQELIYVQIELKAI